MQVGAPDEEGETRDGETKDNETRDGDEGGGTHMPEGCDLNTELSADHRHLEELYTRILATPRGDGARKTLVTRASVDFIRHAAAEEHYLLPAVREYLPDGEAAADKQIRDRARITRLAQDLESSPDQDDRFEETLHRMVIAVGEHVADQDAKILPMLAQAMPPEMVDRLGDRVREDKRQAQDQPFAEGPDRAGAGRAPRAGILGRLRAPFMVPRQRR
jgi:hemerythrin superfamily protein